jgi:hypothetical protein
MNDRSRHPATLKDQRPQGCQKTVLRVISSLTALISGARCRSVPSLLFDCEYYFAEYEHEYDKNQSM